MKQTNNAIKFLMAQYRAIYKHAYIKGVLSAFAISSTLAVASTAQATQLNEDELLEESTTSAYSVQKANIYDSGAASWDAVTDTSNMTSTSASDIFAGNTANDHLYFNNVNVQNGHNLTVTSIKKDNGLKVQGTLTVNQGATLNVGTDNSKGYITGYNEGGTAPSKKADKTGKLVSSGNINIGSGQAKATVQMNAVHLKSGSVTVLKGEATPPAKITGPLSLDKQSYFYAGFTDNSSDSGNNFVIDSGAKVTINDHAHIGTSLNSTMNINGEVTLKGTESIIRVTDTFTSKGTRSETHEIASGNDGELILGDTSNIIVEKNGANSESYILSPKTTLQGTITVKNGGKLTLDGDIDNKTIAIAESKRSAGIFNMEKGTINIEASGALTLGNGKEKNAQGTAIEDTITTFNLKSGSISNTGTFNVHGLLNLSGGTIDNKGTLSISGDATNYSGSVIATSGTLKNTSGATINIQSGDLFLKGADLQNAGTIAIKKTGTLKVELDSHSTAENTNANNYVVDFADLGTINNSGTISFNTSTANKTEPQNKGFIAVTNENLTAFNSATGTISLADANTGMIVTDKATITANNSEGSKDIFNNSKITGNGSLIFTDLDFIASGDNTLSTASINTVVNGTLNIKKPAKSTATEAKLTATNLVLNDTLNSDYDVVALQDASNVTLDTQAYDVTRYLDTTSTGNINTALKLSGTSTLTVAASVENKQNIWNTKNIDLLTGTTLTVGKGSKLNISGTLTNAGTVNINNNAVVSASGKVTNSSKFDLAFGSSFTVNGDGKTDTVDFSNTGTFTNNGTLDLGNAADTINLTFTAGTDGNGGTFTSGIGTKISGDGIIKVDLSGITGSDKMTIADLNNVYGSIATGNGIASISGTENIDLGVTENTETGNKELSADNIANIEIKFENDTTKNTVVTGLGGDKNITGGGWKGLQAANGNTTINAQSNTNTNLYGVVNSTTNNIAQTADGKVVGITVGDGAKVNVAGVTGNIGKISGNQGTFSVNNGANVSVTNTNGTADDISDLDTLQVADAQINANNVSVNSLNTTGTVKADNKVTVDTADIAGNVVAKEFVSNTLATISGQVVADKISFNTANIEGGLISGATTTISGTNINLSENAVVNVKSLTLNSNGVLRVGTENTDTTEASSAQLTAETLNLAGGKLVIDPDFGDKTATVFVKQFNTSSSKTLDVNGNVIVGQNSALGIGGTEADFHTALAQHQHNGSLKEDDIGAYVYVGEAGVDLSKASLVVGVDTVENLEKKVEKQGVYLGNNSGVQFSTKSMQADNKTAFTNVKKVTANDSATLIVPAHTQASEIAKLFNNDATLAFEGTKQTISVRTENGLFSGELKDLQGTDFTFNISSNARNILADLSDNTYDYVMMAMSTDKIYKDYKALDAAEKAEAETGVAAYDKNGVAVVNEGAGYNFLKDAAGSFNSIAIEHAARLAIFGGAVHSAYVASNSTTDAINGRMGMGNSEAKLTVADNKQGAAVWVTPIYRSFEADGLSTSGTNYGTDLDFFGAALGFDYTLANNLRFGIMANVGSGDSDGKNIASGVSNDFDYFGFGIYAGFSPINNLSLTADVSYTKTDNDISANANIAGWDKLTASTDTDAISAGIGAQYTIKASSIDVAPHIGLRYTKLDMDHYTIKSGKEVIAESAADDLNVFSIPFGVSLSKDFVSSSWTIRPVFDITLTANAGDKDMNSYTYFTGVEGIDVGYKTDILDSFTYGGSLGVTGSNGSFSFGINVGYTRSSDTDELSGTANARFTF